MSSIKLIHTRHLSNGLTICIYDHTKVYFGDYHHVRVNIVCFFDSAAVHWLQYCPDNIDIRSISYTRTLERMGVPSQDVATAIETLLKDFDLNSLSYIASPDFPKKMINKELSCKKSTVRKYLGSGS